jgi:phosphoribosylanthranilate isomerase
MDKIMPLIKICGVRDKLIAKQAAMSGADFIGMVFYPASKRHIELTAAKEITAATLDAGAIPVAVVVDTDIDEIMTICETTKISTVQLHGKISRKKQAHLPAEIQRIYVCAVDKEGNITEDNAEAIQQLDPNRDFLLFDNLQPGSGKPFNWENFHYTGAFRWFLSGGLSPENVAIAADKVNPFGVDVSSGVESSPGIKNMPLIKNFINQVKSNYE